MHCLQSCCVAGCSYFCAIPCGGVVLRLVRAQPGDLTSFTVNGFKGKGSDHTVSRSDLHVLHAFQLKAVSAA